MTVKMTRQGFLKEQLYSFAKWFYRHVPVLVLDPATSQQVRRYSQLADRQWVRRAMAGLNTFVLAAVLASWMGIAYRHHMRHLGGDSLFGRIVMFTTAASGSFSLCMVLFYSKWLYWFAGTSREDPGMSEYEIPLDKLKTAQRRPLLERYRAELLKRSFYPDERQSEEQERAERTAFRLLRRMAILIALGLWAVYLIAPGGAFGRLLQSGETLFDSPLVLSWIVIALIALPTLIRLWTEPDEPG
jgi:hypothetical protein